MKMNVNPLFIKSIRASSQLINYQTLRWRRYKKPFWLGIAKSKMFIVPQPKVFPTAEEKNEFETLKELYEVQLGSLLNFMKNDNLGRKEADEMVTDDGKRIDLNLPSKITKSLELNEEFNAESARRRELRMQEEKEKKIKNAALVIETEEEKKRNFVEMMDRIVREEKVLSQTYITRENLDEAVEKCLDKIDCFDFAIDIQGNRYSGRESLAATPKADTEILNDKTV